jgi:hypothetical protein
MDRGLEDDIYVIWSDIIGFVVGILDVRWSIRWSEPDCSHLQRADKGVATTESKTNEFTMHSILLHGEDEHHECSSSHVIISGPWC